LANFKQKTVAEMAAELNRHFQSVQSFMQANEIYQLRNTVKRQNELPMAKLPELELAYLAGIVDGEGTITVARRFNKKLNKTYYQPLLTVCNTSTLLRNWLHQRGFSSILSTSTGGKPCWKMSLGGPGVSRACQVMLPYLVIKEQQAVLVMDFVKRRSEQAFRTKPTPQMLLIYQDLRRLNWRCARPNEFASPQVKSITTS
jgi:hypothetical protein